VAETAEQDVLAPGALVEIPVGQWRDAFGVIGEFAFRGKVVRVTLGAPDTFGPFAGPLLGVSMEPRPEDGQPVDAGRRVSVYLRPDAVSTVRLVS
jgi:hypothetical protein